MTDKDFEPPKAPKDLCFNELDFVEVYKITNSFLQYTKHKSFSLKTINILFQKVFDTDHFLQEHRKNVSLEKMRDDLGIYLKILRSAMIELINKDYADFVNLSSNLIGLDKAINNLETPLGQLKEEVMVCIL